MQLRKIGAGTFGTAILCEVKGLPGEVLRKVVVKKISIQDLSDDERRTARREAALLAVRHKHFLVVLE